MDIPQLEAKYLGFLLHSSIFRRRVLDYAAEDLLFGNRNRTYQRLSKFLVEMYHYSAREVRADLGRGPTRWRNVEWLIK